MQWSSRRHAGAELFVVAAAEPLLLALLDRAFRTVSVSGAYGANSVGQ